MSGEGKDGQPVTLTLETHLVEQGEVALITLADRLGMSYDLVINKALQAYEYFDRAQRTGTKIVFVRSSTRKGRWGLTWKKVDFSRITFK